MRIAIIGGGNMGEAMLSALISHKIALPQDITVSDVEEQRRAYLVEKYPVKATASNVQAASGQDVVVLAIKPQVISAILAELNSKLTGQLVISIVAGIRVGTICSGLNHQAVVRSMPNTPAQIGEGITVWTASPAVTPRQKQIAGKILGAMGVEIYVDDERYLDMATAISGSGPAYLYYFVEALIEAAVSIGWNAEQAKTLVMGTILGSAHLLQQSGKDPDQLRQAVTSKGGTTAAAIAKLEIGNFKSLITQAVKSALNRAKELGGNK